MKNKIYFFLIGFFLILFAFSSCEKSGTNEKTQTVTVAGLLSLTGNWSTLGVCSQAAMDIAAEDINAYMKQTNSNYLFTTTIYDTKLDTALAAGFINDAKVNNIQFVIGPQSSAEVGAIKAFADANNMLVISQGSTAGKYAIAGDNIYRFCPPDKIEGAAIAATIYKASKKGLITVARDDAGNKGLQTVTGTVFASLGGAVANIAPYSTTTTDFSSVIAGIKTNIETFSALYGLEGTAVYLASFDECVQLFQQASADPVLSSVNWYGGDGVTLSAALTSDAAAAAFATATKFFAPTFGLPSLPDPERQTLSDAIKSRTGITPDAFALASYDAMWVIAFTILNSANVQNDFNKEKSIFEKQANSYYGVTGPTLLDDAGDRSIGSFDYWGIVNEGGAWQWKFAGKSE